MCAGQNALLRVIGLYAHVVVGIAALPTSLEFGELPTATLGKGCTAIHSEPLYAGSSEVEPPDKFYFKPAGSAELLHCTIFNVTCEYGSSTIKSTIDHNGTHLKNEGSNLPRILIRNTLLRTGGSGLCPAEGFWEATLSKPAYAGRR